jgi:hypothetical protein
MCSVACHLAVKFLPLSRELFVIRYTKTQTASFRIIIVQKNLCFKSPCPMGKLYSWCCHFKSNSHFRPQFPQNPRTPSLWVTSMSLSTSTLNLNLSQSQRPWTWAPSVTARGVPTSGIKMETVLLPPCVCWLAWLRSEAHTPFWEVNFAFPINFQAFVWFMIMAATQTF